MAVLILRKCHARELACKIGYWCMVWWGCRYIMQLSAIVSEGFEKELNLAYLTFDSICCITVEASVP